VTLFWYSDIDIFLSLVFLPAQRDCRLRIFSYLYRYQQYLSSPIFSLLFRNHKKTWKSSLGEIRHLEQGERAGTADHGCDRVTRVYAVETGFGFPARWLADGAQVEVGYAECVGTSTSLHGAHSRRGGGWSAFQTCSCFSVFKCIFKGTGTRDLIWLKVVSLDRSWLVGLTDNL